MDPQITNFTCLNRLNIATQVFLGCILIIVFQIFHNSKNIFLHFYIYFFFLSFSPFFTIPSPLFCVNHHSATLPFKFIFRIPLIFPLLLHITCITSPHLFRFYTPSFSVNIYFPNQSYCFCFSFLNISPSQLKLFSHILSSIEVNPILSHIYSLLILSSLVTSLKF